MRKTLLSALILAALAAPAHAEPPAVLVSIKPLHSLVASVMRGVGEPGLIVSGTASPHGYTMRPSDARALEHAKLVVWVGKEFETWLERPLNKRPDALSMAALPGLTRLDTREGGVWEPHDHGHEHHDDHGHHDDHDEVDGHLWLDTGNAALLVNAVAERLSALDPANAPRYAANAADTRRSLEALDSGLKAQLAPVADRPYVVFHDAHQYFERRYGLTPAGAITVDPERPPGAKRMAALRERLRTAKAACVFGEPGTPAATARTLADSAGVRLGQLDPEGLLVPAGPDSYVQQMQGIATAIVDCLSAR